MQLPRRCLTGGGLVTSSRMAYCHFSKTYPRKGVGAHSTISRAIVDKNARIGRQVRIVNQAHVQEANQEDLGFVIRNGIVVVIKNATIPDGMVI